ncbi:DMT family transporter [Novosphingobium sp. P6W]|uniref:DMT family transporter n=1 Tax=Novosphingobium sp. P6W TaxID=1609758 RepID=UPI000DEB3447|nr:DMT family transporter [Novosphingobium sp. P6W]AXB76257.1 EamA/RhaT family transporter [Novosphingobium sp. P6W]
MTPAPNSPVLNGRSKGNGTAAGVACGVGAGALWGLVFLAPELAHTFSPLQLTVGRYLSYGLIAAALLAPRWRRLVPRIGRREWLSLMWLSLAGNTVYYILLASAVQIGGIAMTSLVIGFLPVAVTIIGSRDHDAVPLGRLAPSLALCIAGAVCIGWQAIAAPASGSVTAQLAGLACAIGALISWTGYAVGNSRCLGRLGDVSVHDWNLLTGVVTGAQNLLLLPVLLLMPTAANGAREWATFAGVSLGSAVLASMGGNALWNRMSRLLPLTMVGQMILFETLFALVYGFAWEQRLPTVLEAGAFVLLALSVMSCIAGHRKPAAERPAR